jgi:putative nucleotidyltransferase with HDIG domain
LALAVLVAVIPVRRIIGTQHINLSVLLVFTALILFGTGTAVVAAWAVGIASAASAHIGNLRVSVQRAMVGTGKHVIGFGAAGVLLWGVAWDRGAVDYGLKSEAIAGILAAYGLYLGIRWTIEATAICLRGDMRFRDLRLPQLDRASIYVWIIPAGAYLLALAYLSSGFLTITMLASVLLVQGLTVGENRRSRSSWVRLTDGLRQACDGHFARHKGETQRVVEIATAVGRKMKLPAANMKLLGHAAALHNVGYIALEPSLVIKPKKLSPEDIAAIRQHPDCSGRILGDVAGMDEVAEIVRCHHESPDGEGYPRGLKADSIPMEAAIVKVVEAFVAMSSPRVYRGKALPRNQALNEIAAATGHDFDPTAAYYLFETMGRGDLASEVSRHFGLPDRGNIRSRLSKRKLNRRNTHSGTTRRSMAKGLALLAGAVGLAIFFDRLGISNPVEAPPSWFTLDLPGALFLVALSGLAAMKPGRLAWGAYCSWASALAMVMVLAGGPIYVPVSGMAFIGWALILGTGSACRIRPERVLEAAAKQVTPDASAGERGVNGDNIPAGTHRIHKNCMHQRVIAIIDRANRVRGDIGITGYSLVLMVASTSAWAACLLAYQALKGSMVGLILSPLLMGVMSIGVFYVAETLLQAALLSRGGLSPLRVWYRNYTNAFPEPLTYAIFGYGIYIVSGAIGLWTAMLFFTLPVLWRQGVLANRISTLRTTNELIRSIAKAVDMKNAPVGAHAAGVATAAVAIARKMGKKESFVEQLEEAAILHDIGKASWPNKALVQRMPWDSKGERYRYIHPDMSAEIAVWAGYPEATSQMIRSHHEHYDGSGYMRGLKADMIPVGARILGGADSFTNMIQGSDPRFSRPLAETVREIRFGSGKQFDPEVVEALVAVIEATVFGDPVKEEAPHAADIPEEIGVGAEAGQG